MSVRLPKRGPTVSERNAGTWLAMILVLFVAVGLLALISLVLPDVVGLVVVLGGFCGFVAVHYFTWGRWLMRHSATAAEERPPDSHSGASGDDSV